MSWHATIDVNVVVFVSTLNAKVFLVLRSVYILILTPVVVSGPSFLSNDDRNLF